MPAKRKPPQIKVLTGSREPNRPQVDLPLVDSIPTAPDWLDETAAHEFNRLARILHNNRLLTEASLSPLAVLALIYGRIVVLCRAGETPHASLIAQYRAFVGDFGITPAAASRVTPGREPAKENPFSKNGRKCLLKP